MDIRNSLDGLKTLLGVTPTTSTVQRSRSAQAAEEGSLSSDSATLSGAGSEVAQTAGEGVVRADKVASVQAALAAGTYEVPASKVATKIVDAMLERDK